MEVVGDLVEEVGRHQIALLVGDINLNRPLSLREALNLRGLVTVITIPPSARAPSLFSRVCMLWCEIQGEGRMKRAPPSPIERVSLYSFPSIQGGVRKHGCFIVFRARKEGKVDHVHDVLLRHKTDIALDLNREE